MEILKAVLIEVLSRNSEIIKLSIDEAALLKQIDNQSLLTLRTVSEVLKNDSLTDFEAIEEIVILLENAGFDCGFRHDF